MVLKTVTEGKGGWGVWSKTRKKPFSVQKKLQRKTTDRPTRPRYQQRDSHDPQFPVGYLSRLLASPISHVVLFPHRQTSFPLLVSMVTRKHYGTKLDHCETLNHLLFHVLGSE